MSYYSGVVVRKIVPLILILAGVALVAGFSLLRYVQSRKPTAGLKIQTTPPSTIFVDNIQVGQTPFEQFFKPGEATVKLVPIATTSALSTYQTKVRLTDGVYTVISRDFGSNDLQSSGEVISLQSQPGQPASLAVITSHPPSASVSLDGQPQGFTPLLVPTIDPGDHQITVSAPGYNSRTITAKAIADYKLNLNVKLAAQDTNSELTSPTPAPSATPSGSPTPSPRISPTIRPLGSPSVTPTTTPSLPKPYVTITNTPTGWLRVRSQPSLSGREVGQVKPGQSFPLLESQSGWYHIKADLPATSSGWISSQYAQKFE